MPVYHFLTIQYAQAIYLFGTRSFQTINPAYIVPVMEYAAVTYSRSQLDNALAQGFITQQEYDDTIAYIPPSGV